MVYLELESLFAVELSNRRQNLYEKANLELLKFNEVSEDTRFFHLLLKKEFAQVKSKPELSGLKILKDRLNKNYPGFFSFVFWSSDGKLIKSLSDDTRFSFLSRKLNVFLKTVRKRTREGLNDDEKFMEYCQRELRIQRQFLGPFITPEGLFKPFLPDFSAACFQLHGRGERMLGWYDKGDSFSVLVYVSDKIRGRLTGPRYLCHSLEKRIPGLTFFLFDEQEHNFIPELSEQIQRQAGINFGKFRKLVSDNNLNSESYSFNFQKLNQRWWAGVAIDRNQIGEVSTFAGQTFALLAVAFALTLYILYCYFLVHKNPWHSVRAKLVLIFCYSLFIPAIVFSVLGFEYLAQKKQQTLALIADQTFQILTSIDNQFKSFLYERANEINKICNSYFVAEKNINFDVSVASFTRSVVEGFDPDTLIIADENGSDVLGGAWSQTIKSGVLRKTASKELIAYLNGGSSNAFKPSEGVSEGFILSFPINHQRMLPFTLNNKTFISYLNTLRDSVTGKFSHIIQIFWRETEMHREFLEKMHEFSRSNNSERFLYSMPSEKYIRSQNLNYRGSSKFLAKVRQKGSAHAWLEIEPGKPVLAFGQVGRNLEAVVLVMLIDGSALYYPVDDLKDRLKRLAGWSLLTSLSLFYILSHFLITPIRAMKEGVDMVRNKKFNFRIQMGANNEFGRLSNSIDSALENLQELEIAKTVQDSLLPQESLELEKYSIVAKTCSMTSLGGDYYDFFSDSENNSVIFMADVAGHGVQAALMMAMAKAVFLVKENACNDPSGILSAMNRTFCELRKSDITTMMTGQLLKIAADGGILFFNAGHCPPLIVASEGKEVSMLNVPAVPFGFKPGREFSPTDLNIKPQETIILYSDGIVESSNRQGVMLGQDGFMEMARSCYHDDSRVYLENLFSAYENWASIQQDDITFVLIRRKGG